MSMTDTHTHTDLQLHIFSGPKNEQKSIAYVFPHLFVLFLFILFIFYQSSRCFPSSHCEYIFSSAMSPPDTRCHHGGGGLSMTDSEEQTAASDPI